ncbi:hypothetical protein JL720_7311 [Aureococcus anophagefferens]|nr:hypothetical protein JL720_7311 [Aureococcus anophagefferens]
MAKGGKGAFSVYEHAEPPVKALRSRRRAGPKSRGHGGRRPVAPPDEHADQAARAAEAAASRRRLYEEGGGSRASLRVGGGDGPEVLPEQLVEVPAMQTAMVKLSEAAARKGATAMDGDALLDPSTFAGRLRKEFKIRLSPEELGAVLYLFDAADADGAVSWLQFMKVFAHLGRRERERAFEARRDDEDRRRRPAEDRRHDEEARFAPPTSDIDANYDDGDRRRAMDLLQRAAASLAQHRDASSTTTLLNGLRTQGRMNHSEVDRFLKRGLNVKLSPRELGAIYEHLAEPTGGGFVVSTEFVAELLRFGRIGESERKREARSRNRQRSLKKELKAKREAERNRAKAAVKFVLPKIPERPPAPAPRPTTATTPRRRRRPTRRRGRRRRPSAPAAAPAGGSRHSGLGWKLLSRLHTLSVPRAATVPRPPKPEDFDGVAPGPPSQPSRPPKKARKAPAPRANGQVERLKQYRQEKKDEEARLANEPRNYVPIADKLATHAADRAPEAEGIENHAEAATPELLKHIADELERGLQRVTQGNWMRFFTMMDLNSSGSMEFHEFVSMARNKQYAHPPGLEISKQSVSDDDLRRLWTSADRDRSGSVNAVEFRRFIERVLDDDRPNSAAPAPPSSAEGDARDAPPRRDAAGEKARDYAPVDADEAETLARVAAAIDKAMRSIPDCSWTKIFILCDRDRSGRIEWPEFRNIVRSKRNVSGTGLELGAATISLEEMRLLWARADNDKLGLINADEFALFLRMAVAKTLADYPAAKAAIAYEQNIIVGRSKEQQDKLGRLNFQQASSEHSGSNATTPRSNASSPRNAPSPRHGAPARPAAAQLLDPPREFFASPPSPEKEVRGYVSGAARKPPPAALDAPRTTKQAERMKALRAEEANATDGPTRAGWKAPIADRLAGNDKLADGAHHESGASPELLRSIAARLDAKLQKHAKGSWAKLFFVVDNDGSGRVEFHEFRDLMRNKATHTSNPGLEIGRKEVSDEELSMLWTSLDGDKSGFVTAPEFKKFMLMMKAQYSGEEQKQEIVKTSMDAPRTTKQAERMKELRAKEAAADDGPARAGWKAPIKDKMAGNSKMADGEHHDEEASPELLKSIAARLDAKLQRHAKGSWAKLFFVIDNDGSGRVEFHEFRDLMRNKVTHTSNPGLEIGKKEISDEELNMLWTTVDADKSGFVTAPEFKRFMLMMKEQHSGVEEKQAITRTSMNAPRTTKQAERMKALRAEEANATDGPTRAGWKAPIKDKMAGNSKMADGEHHDDEASPELLKSIAARLDAKLQRHAKGSWAKLFFVIDNDGSGRVEFHEFRDLMRNKATHTSNPGLEISKSEVSDTELSMLWTSLDNDKSGFVTAPEFKKFMLMMKEQHSGVEEKKAITRTSMNAPRTTKQAERMKELRAKEANATDGPTRAGWKAPIKDKMDGNSKMTDGEHHDDEASPELLKSIAARLDAKLQRHAKGSWAKLFFVIDNDGSGRVEFHEFRDLMRNKATHTSNPGLEISKKEVSDDELSMLWTSLDGDKSGFVTAPEFKVFMETVKTHHSGEEEKQVITRTSMNAPRTTKQAERMKALRAEQASATDGPTRAGWKAPIKDRMDGNSKMSDGEHHDDEASPELLKSIAARLDAKLQKHAKGSWAKLFFVIDNDGSGRVEFHEFRDLMRNKATHTSNPGLEIGKGEVSDTELSMLWTSLDGDKSGFVTAPEFKKFMEMIKSHHSGEEEKQVITRTSMNAPRTTKQAERMKELRAKEASATDGPTRAGWKAPIKEKLGTNKNFDAGEHHDDEASPELLKSIAARLDAKLQKHAKGSWAKLFFVIDNDGSGRVEFHEFRDLMRNKATDTVNPGLEISKKEVSDDELSMLWTSLDGDKSGFVTAPEFKVFMETVKTHHSGEEEKQVITRTSINAPRTTKQAERMKALRAEQASATDGPTRAGWKAPIKEKLGTNKNFDAGEHHDDEASPELLKSIAARLDAKLQKHAKGSWAKLFFVIDNDGSGRVEFHEFRDLMRNKATDTVNPGLEISKKEVSDDELSMLWTSLDGDKSGFVTAPEFKVFMETVKTHHSGEEEKQVITRTSMNAPRTTKQAERMKALRAEQASATDGPTRAGWKAPIKDRMDGNSKMADGEHHDDEASPELLKSIAARLDAKLQKHAKGSWAKLFFVIDNDGSGRVEFHEFRDLMRNKATDTVNPGLEISKKEVSDDELSMLWTCLDGDKSGFVTAPEFKRFMQKVMAQHAPGEEPTEVVRTSMSAPRTTKQAERMKELRAKEAAADGGPARAGWKAPIKDKLDKNSNFDDGAHHDDEASPEVLAAVARRLEARVRDVAAGSWAKLFFFVDNDGSGRVEFREFRDLIRNRTTDTVFPGLEMGRKEVSDDELSMLWTTLDGDRSGFVTAPEFKAFLGKLTAASGGAEELKQEIVKTSIDAPRTTKQAERMKALRADEAAAAPARAGSKAPIADRLATNSNFDAGTHADEAASPRLLRLVANMLEAAVGRRCKGSWAKLFFATDKDGSGRIEFDEFRALVRRTPGDALHPGLGVGRDAISDGELGQLWAAVDADRSGSQARRPPAPAAPRRRDDDDYGDDDFDPEESAEVVDDDGVSAPSILSSLMALDDKRRSDKFAYAPAGDAKPPDDYGDDDFEDE